MFKRQCAAAKSCRNTIPGEQTGFRHVDFNVKDYIETGRGANTLEGSVSFTDEYAQNCTKLLTGDVRLSFPALPHGSTGPCTIVQRTVLPWFMAIKDDHITLDTAESGSWNDIANAHCELMNAPRTPSGLTSTRMGGPQYSLAGAV
jgi:hypothetical protein